MKAFLLSGCGARWGRSEEEGEERKGATRRCARERTAGASPASHDGASLPAGSDPPRRDRESPDELPGRSGPRGVTPADEECCWCWYAMFLSPRRDGLESGPTVNSRIFPKMLKKIREVHFFSPILAFFHSSVKIAPMYHDFPALSTHNHISPCHCQPIGKPSFCHCE